MDCANFIAGSYLRLDTVKVSGSTKMRTMKNLDTLLRHHRGYLYSEPLYPDLLSLHHSLHLKTQVQLSHPRFFSSRISNQLQIPDSGPDTQTQYSRLHSVTIRQNSNGSTQKAIGTKGKASRNKNAPSNSSQRKTAKKEVSEPSQSAYPD